MHTSANRSAVSGVVDAGFRTTVLPGGEGRRDLPREHQQREVPRDDLRRNAEWPGHPSRKRVVELVRPAGVVPEVVRRERHVDVAALLDRLAGVHRLEDGELAAPLLEDPGDPEQVLRALLAGQAAPARPLRAAGGADRAVDVRRRRLRDLGDDLLGRGIDALEDAAVRRLDLAPVDEQAVARLDRDDVPGFGRRGVLPGHRLPIAEAPVRRGPIPRPGSERLRIPWSPRA